MTPSVLLPWQHFGFPVLFHARFTFPVFVLIKHCSLIIVSRRKVIWASRVVSSMTICHSSSDQKWRYLVLGKQGLEPRLLPWQHRKRYLSKKNVPFIFTFKGLSKKQTIFYFIATLKGYNYRCFEQVQIILLLTYYIQSAQNLLNNDYGICLIPLYRQLHTNFDSKEITGNRCKEP